MINQSFDKLAKEEHSHRKSVKEDLHQHHHSHEDRVKPHVHTEESLRKIINRLSRIEGHIRGIKTMVNESRPCPEVLVQIAAVRGALDRVARIILDEHLSECI
ncbi:MAG: metal-sensitive transcriptional regulator, partial [Kamptonema sp. SIO1D9]|nr:metal-sensitive transcriptional regulator [Kamptonema sp. SIO1D9]